MTNAVFVVFLLGLVRLSGACTPTSRGINTFGPDCQYMCHCLNGILCDSVTGECSNGCEPGWFGPGCQFRDIAYKEVSRHNSNMVAYKYAPNGNDGNTKTCSYTNNASLSVTYPWWRVWLPRNETLHELTILTNDDGMGYFSNFTVTVEYVPESKRYNNEYEPSYRQICHQTTNKITESKQIHVLCVTPLVGNHLRIQLDLINAQLILCDVRVNRGRNVAFASSATVSSRNNNDLYGPTNAVDGVLTNITWEFCFVSGDKKDNWILVDLGRFIYVTYVNITKFNDEKLRDYIINVSNTSDSWHTVYNDTLNLPPTTQVSLNITTRYIELRRPTRNRFIICELQIFGNCPANKCGYECNEECHCKGLETLENKMNGICSTGCDSRWTGTNGKCNKCVNNTWGEACSNECGACKDSTCDVKTGKCPNGCQIGHYETDMCTQVCVNGTWGLNCNRTCGNCLHGVCNASIGSCQTGCASGYKNTSLCTEACQNKSWGLNCNKTCGNCLHDVCDTSDGVCSSGCTSGYKNTTHCTKACDKGTWGLNCNTTCGNCLLGVCNASDGSCDSGCERGYKNTTLCTEVCDNGTWGLNCNQTCGKCLDDICNASNGSCKSGCASGYKNTTLCTEECDNGTYEMNCSRNCSPNCEDICNKVNGSCTCLPGWTGDFCGMACGEGTWGYYCNRTCGNCSVDECNASDGDCESGCATGYKVTPLCIEVCDDGTYGSNCSGTCSVNCHDTCNKKDGTCVQCEPGWTGDLCQEECDNGTYGFECNYTCSVHCQDTCNKIDGHCSKCEVGWNGTLCDKECENGTYGDGCSFICGKCMDNASCHKMNGRCAVGCTKGYKGSLCTTRSEPLTEAGVPSAAIGGGVSAVVVLLLVVVGVIFFWRRKQLSSKANGSTSNLHDIGLNDVCSTEEETDGTLSIKKADHQIEDYYKFEGVVTHDSQPRAIVLKELAEFVKTHLAQEGFFDKEFQDIPYGLQFPTAEAMKAYNAGKNRYKEMYAYDHTRVILSTLPTNPHSDYINASYIKGYQKERAYIATQGPTDANMEDFWRMIWEEDVQLIAMVTNLVENTKMKCIKYWVSVERSKQYGDITVFTESEESFAEFDIRRFRLSKQGESIQRNVVQYAYTAWPDKDVPSSTCSLLHFWNKFRKNDENKTHPWLVHCSAGVGRTGTFIALDILYDQGKDAGYIDINMCVRKLREQRVNMVQKAAQYAYLHRIMVEALVLPSQPVALSQFDPWYNEQLGFDKKTGKTKLMLEFESMVDDTIFVTSTDEKAYKDDACVYENTQADHKSRNRYSNIIAADGFRPFLSTYVAGTNNYINAVYIPSYNDLHGYLVTQTPLPDTAVDCCRLVIEQEIHVIVTFDDDGDNTVGVYLPSNGSIEIGPFKVTLTSTKEEDGYLIRKYIIVYKSKEHTVIQFIYKKWSTDKLVPEDTYHVLEFLHKVDKQDRQFDNKPTLVQCLNGAERSGLFVVLMHVIERARIDEEVSIPQVVRYLRIRRQQIVPNYEQYKFCHEVILCYAESNSTYANM